MIAKYVLHVVPPNGGGVDRYVRDICSRRAGDFIAHVSEDQVVLEHPRGSTFFPIDFDAKACSGSALPQVVSNLVGQPSVVHAHSSVAPVRAVVNAICARTNADYVVTLHDIEFAHTLFPLERHEAQARIDFARGALVRIAPSKYVADLADVTLGQMGACAVVANGVARGIAPESFSEAGAAAGVSGAIPKCRVAVVGALGAHKGLEFLREVANVRRAGEPIVVVGYVDGQITQGWLSPNKLWVHGAFEPSELRAVLNAYEVELVLFPNRQPEGYSYALSDVWCAGRPVLVPDAGALGERVRAAGAGWVFPVDSTPADVAILVDDYVNKTKQLAEIVVAATTTILGVDDMVAELNAIYSQAHQTTAAIPDLRELSALAAKHLDGAFFRAELRRLEGDLAFLQRQRDESDLSVVNLSNESRAKSEQLAQREVDIASLRSECHRLEQQLRTEHQTHSAYAEKLQADVRATLAVAHRYERALAVVPGPLRRMLLQRADRTLAKKGSRD